MLDILQKFWKLRGCVTEANKLFACLGNIIWPCFDLFSVLNKVYEKLTSKERSMRKWINYSTSVLPFLEHFLKLLNFQLLIYTLHTTYWGAKINRYKDAMTEIHTSTEKHTSTEIHTRTEIHIGTQRSWLCNHSSLTGSSGWAYKRY